MAKFKVVRTWCVEADSTVDAIEKTRNFNHLQVAVKRLTGKVIAHACDCDGPHEMDCVYMLLEETDAWGVWTDPKDAVLNCFGEDIKEKDGVQIIEFRKKEYTIQEMVERMLDPNSNYPVLAKIEVNPTKEPWTMDR